MRLGPIVAAVLLPPLGIWLSEGTTANFWIGLLLTIVGFVPGMIFALLVVLRPGLIPPIGRRRTVVRP